jgi:hypothetical protein
MLGWTRVVGYEINTVTRSVTTNSVNTSKTTVTGQKRKRHGFSDVQTTFLEVQLKDGNLDNPEGGQKVDDDLAKQTNEPFHVDRANTWFRNHKSKNE